MKEMFINKCIGWLWITQGVFAPKVAKVFGVKVEVFWWCGWWGLMGAYPLVDFGWGIGLRINNTIK